MNKNILAGVAALTAVAGCATTPQAPYRTPQVTIVGATVDQVKLPIIQNCVSGGGSVESNSDHQVICAKPMDDSFGSLMYRALATPQYSTNPVLRARSTLVQSGGNVFVTIDTYSQYQNAYGQVNTTPIQNNSVGVQAQAMLDGIKASIEGQGTTAGEAGTVQETPQVAPANASPPLPEGKRSDWRTWGTKKSD